MSSEESDVGSNISVAFRHGDGTRQGQEKQEDMWVASGDVARSPGHPFYQRLNELLDGEKFDELAEVECAA